MTCEHGNQEEDCAECEEWVIEFLGDWADSVDIGDE